MGTQDSEQDNVNFMIGMGFHPEESRDALKKTNNNMERAIDLLTTQRSQLGANNKQIVLYDQPQNAGSVPGASSQQPANDADAQLKQAMESSKKEQDAKENLELMRAIAMSMDTGSQSQPMDVDNSGAPKISEEERLMNQAIEQSLQVTSGEGNTFENPTSVKREPGAPVGLKNVGNTCYVNSLLQTYFMIPSLRAAVLRYTPKLPSPPADGSAQPQQQVSKIDEDTIDFMKELQRLFAYLILTNKSFVDPSQLLKKLKDKSGNPLKIGNQEDVSEFNDLFLENVERGLKADYLVVGENSEFVRKLFYGTAIQFISGREQDESDFEVQNTSVFNHLILRVGPELPNLFASLDSYVYDTVDYTTEKGYKTKALATTWFKAIPPILMFQQSRVGFDQATKTYQKSVAPLVFDKEIWMDRYLVENRAETTAIRAKVTQLNEELSKLEAQLHGFTRYKGRDHSLDAALASTIDYLRDKQVEGSLDPLYVNSMLETLGRCHDFETKNIQGLRDKIEFIRQQIAAAYSHMRAHPYTLYAVWVHQGVAGSGHYWAFLRDPRTDRWIRFNDMRTNPVSETEVMKESIGGHANSSAYFLLYVDKNTIDSIPFKEGDSLLKIGQEEALTTIPDTLKQEINDANVKFNETVENYEKNSVEAKVKVFSDHYKQKIEEIVKNTKELTAEHDYRIKSLWTFMFNQGLEDLARVDILLDMYSYEFQRGLSHDIDSDIYRKVGEVLGKDLLDQAKALAGDPSRVDSVRHEHRNFQDVVQMCATAMDLLLAKKCTECGNKLLRALQRDRELPFPTAHREEDIVFLMKICIQSMLGEVTNKLAQNKMQEAALEMRDVVGFTIALGTTDSIMISLKQKLAEWARDYPVLSNFISGFARFIELTGTTTRPPVTSKEPLPPPAKLTPEEGAALMTRFAETYKRVTTEFFQ